MGRGSGIAMIGAALVLALAVAACKGNVDQEPYAAANSEILDALPVFPGATEVDRGDTAQWVDDEDGGGRVVAWGTRIVYRVGPDVTDEDVVQFHMDELGDEWRRCKSVMPIGSQPPDVHNLTAVNFIREDGAAVFVWTDGLNELQRAGVFEVSVDHDATEDPCTGEKLR